MNRRYLDSKRRCNGRTSWYTWVKTKAPSDEPTVHFIVAPDELLRRSSKASSTG
jgi:hypothetical protein